MTNTIFVRRATMLAAAVAACYPLWAGATSAGRVDFATGNVVAVSPTGEKRVLAKGSEVREGETLDTAGGRAQVRFSDGARVSLQPNTQFRIEEYRFAGKSDGTERGIFELISGGMRTITGLIGKANRDNYQVRTRVATIGIRGTEYNVQYVNSIAGGVGQGRIAVCNNAGCSEFGANESFIVTDINTLPQQTFKKMELEDAGATASDALWAGVPVLTRAGQAFASRMAGSLLNAVGMPELVTESADELHRTRHPTRA